jgi:hypothetical protein
MLDTISDSCRDARPTRHQSQASECVRLTIPNSLLINADEVID